MDKHLRNLDDEQVPPGPGVGVGQGAWSDTVVRTAHTERAYRELGGPPKSST